MRLSIPLADLLRLMAVDLLKLVVDLAPFVDLLRLIPALETVFVPSVDLLRLNVSRVSFVDLLMKLMAGLENVTLLVRRL